MILYMTKTTESDGGDRFKPQQQHLTCVHMNITSRSWCNVKGLISCISMTIRLHHWIYSISNVCLEVGCKWGDIMRRAWQHLEELTAGWKLAGTFFWRITQSNCLSWSILLLHWILQLQNCQSNLDRKAKNNNASQGGEKPRVRWHCEGFLISIWFCIHLRSFIW